MDPDTNELLTELNRMLCTLIRLVAFQVAEGKTLADAAPILKRLGLSRSEIAAVVESTPKAVSVRLAEAKRKRKPGTGRK